MNAQLIDHIAAGAAERGDSTLEDLCDSIAAGDSDEDLVLCLLQAARGPDVTDYDWLPDWVDYQPWQSRTAVLQTEPCHRARGVTVRQPYRTLAVEAEAWVAEYRAGRVL